MTTPKEIVCPYCFKNKTFFYNDDRQPKLMKWHITINTLADEEEDVPGHCWEVEMPDDFSAHTAITLFKMFLRGFKP